MRTGSGIKHIFLSLILVAAGILIYLYMIERVSPRASVVLQVPRSEIVQKARDALTQAEFEIQHLNAEAIFEFNFASLIYLQDSLSLKEVNRLVRSGKKPIHWWVVYFYDRSLPRWVGSEEYEVYLDTMGRLLGFRRTIQPDAYGTSLIEEDAIDLAVQYLVERGVRMDDYFLKQASSIRHVHRTDWDFQWQRHDGVYGIEENLLVTVQGEEIGRSQFRIDPPRSFMDVYYQRQENYQFSEIISLATIFLLFFLVVIVFLKRYHEGEVGIRSAILVLIFGFVVALFDYLNIYGIIGSSVQLGAMNRANVRMVLFFVTVFIFLAFIQVMTFTGWSVGESFARSLWKDKLNSFDAMLNRKFLAYSLGVSITRGYGYGFAGMGVLLFLFAGMIEVFGLRVFAGSLTGVPEAVIPALKPVLEGIWVALVCEIVFRLFLLSLIKSRLRKQVFGVIVSVPVWTIASYTIWNTYGTFDPIIFTGIYIAVAGLWFTYLFLRYDLMTAYTANAITIALSIAVPILFSEGSYYKGQSFLLMGLAAVPFVIGCVAVLWGREFKFTPDTIPPHIRRITQRERMSKELEIARSVQMSLLPKKTPSVEGFDIAGICIPAQEVGGDYYDYVHFRNGNLGIAVGDVSGKGVPAAIYMTLTKGILQSNADEFTSPKDVLIKVNSQLYGTIERNTFVSMVYAVIDVESRVMRYSRAGHNPLIMAHLDSYSAKTLLPAGIALGLDKGPVFIRSLEEHSVQLKSGDVLTFYTDGFTEARRGRDTEFGQDQFMRIITNHRSEPARKIVSNSLGEIKKFRGEYPQHDDMTIVVVKVL
jgi:phosphoserine phosphatase RsbU/P